MASDTVAHATAMTARLRKGSGLSRVGLSVDRAPANVAVRSPVMSRTATPTAKYGAVSGLTVAVPTPPFTIPSSAAPAIAAAASSTPGPATRPRERRVHPYAPSAATAVTASAARPNEWLLPQVGSSRTAAMATPMAIHAIKQRRGKRAVADVWRPRPHQRLTSRA